MLRRILRAAIIVSLGIATFAYSAAEKRVTVRIEGEPVAVRTTAGTVETVLERAGVALGTHDKVEPPLPTPVADGAVIEVRRAKTVTLLLDGKPRDVLTTGLTIQEVLEEADLAARPADKLLPGPAAPVAAGMTISLERAVSVVVKHDGRSRRVITNADSIHRLVAELGIKLRARDYVVPAQRLEPLEGMVIRVLRVKLREVTRRERVPYTTILRRESNMEYGERKVVQSGRAGIHRVRYQDRFLNGERVSRRVIRRTVLTAKRDQIVAVGAGYPGCVCNAGTEVGDATWYGEADGMTAAHKTLPIGTVVRVENLANGAWVNVTIRDRGPYGEGRIIDLSDEAFARLAPLSKGVINVRIRW
ncbi:MAG TPA: ubiquitin-like domain-containing protein [Actinomycetota bacterium]